MYPGLGSQELLAASLTAVLLGGWILFLMRQVSPSPQPQVLLRVPSGELFPSSPRPQPLCPPPSSDSVPCFLSAAPWCCARPRQAPLLGQHGAGPGQAHAAQALVFQQHEQHPVEKQQEAAPAPAGPPPVSQDAASQPSGATPQDQKRLQSPSEQAQPFEDPEGER